MRHLLLGLTALALSACGGTDQPTSETQTASASQAEASEYILTFHGVPDEISMDDYDAAERGELREDWLLAEWFDSENQRRAMIVIKEPMLTEKGLSEVEAGSHPTSSGYIVNFTLTPEAADIFGDYTADNVGSQFAVLFEGQVLTAPNINSPIRGGQGYIERFDEETAQALADQINNAMNGN